MIQSVKPTSCLTALILMSDAHENGLFVVILPCGNMPYDIDHENVSFEIIKYKYKQCITVKKYWVLLN